MDISGAVWFLMFRAKSGRYVISIFMVERHMYNYHDIYIYIYI